MPIIKCKMCGGDIRIADDKTFGSCEHCGSTMTFPKVSDDQRASAFNRGNQFRLIGEYDKALAVYERIVAEDDTDPEAHWCCALCRFGIEYVEDSNTLEYVPTCHRLSFDSFLEDVDYLAALKYSEGITRRQYQKDAQKIDRVQREFLTTSQNEEPYDVFICYKESEDDGKRTRDSLYAQVIYYQLTKQGRRVFFSRITLEDKARTEYEPYIFAAINSAKVMILVTTSAEHASAVWVKNEWSRFLSLMRKDRSKMLLPCYYGMDPNNLPVALSVLQSYDISEIDFIQDLAWDVNKILDGTKPEQTIKEIFIAPANANTGSLLKRAFLFLEDGNWAEADAYCERVLDLEPENAEAYLGKLMAELHIRRQEELQNCEQPFNNSNNYQKAIRFGDDKIAGRLSGYIDQINERNENTRITGIYDNAANSMRIADSEAAYQSAAEVFKTISGFKDADFLAERCLELAEQARNNQLTNTYKEYCRLMTRAKTEAEFNSVAEMFKTISGFQDADALAEQCLEKAEIWHKNSVYDSARLQMTRNTVSGLESAIKSFSRISGWRDADEQKYVCERRIKEIKAQEEAHRLEHERQVEEKRIAAETAVKRREKTNAIILLPLIIFACVMSVILLTTVISPIIKAPKTVTPIQEPNAALNDTTRSVSVGDFIKFGSYEQDNDISNGSEDIEWLVLAKEDGRALVISKYALDCQQYNTLQTHSTWETCSLRKWLNETFLECAFSEEERTMISSVTVSADKNSNYGTSSGNSTQDKVFLLSIAEANKYFAGASARQCKGTAYCYAKGAYKGSNGNCWWWLRSPGGDSYHAASVINDGSVYDYGYTVNYENRTVRPALWINLGSLNEELKQTVEKQEKISKTPNVTVTQLQDSNATLKDTIRNASVGDIIKFGAYEQDNDTSNGKEDIEWLVLAKEGDKVLVISKYALDCQKYNKVYTNVTWETCTLRKWLNGTFFNSAFSPDELDMIQITKVTADKNPNYDTLPGNSVDNKIFLLSVQEAEKYFKSDQARKCVPTDYAISQGVWKNSSYAMVGKNNCLWWLRSPGYSYIVAAYVSSYGSVDSCLEVNYFNVAVRPALWIELGS